MIARRPWNKNLLAVTLALPSLVGCPIIPPASQWGPTDVGCLDHWSLVHFGSGLLLGEAPGGESLLPTATTLVGWEVVEPLFWGGETGVNQICDIGVGGLGWLTSQAVGR